MVSFNWTPGHASIKGNEIADQLAKEAEALEVNTQVFTKQDIWKAARDVVTKKWQVRWDSSNSGRHYYRFHKVLKDKVKNDLPNKRLYTVINSLRTGYSKLNAYQFHQNQHLKNDKCEHCNQREDVKHYLWNCRKYENEREILIQKFISSEETLNWIWILYLKWTRHIWKISFQLWQISARRPIDFKIRIALFILFYFFPVINSFLFIFLPLIISNATYKLTLV